MKKKCISILIIAVLVLGTCTVALADGTTSANATRSALKSYGNVVYTNGKDTVKIYSEDFYTLADQLDSFKTCVADQLAEMNTYLSTGSKGTSLVSDSSIRVVHTTPSKSNVVDPLTVDFDTLLEGLAASQSIPFDVTEYGYKEGTALYKTPAGELTTDASKDDVEQINITAAKPENLSAGSAAWVNGELILGTGADNKAYYDQNGVNMNYFTDISNFSYSNSKVVISEPGKYLVLYYIAGTKSGDPYSYWVLKSGYPSITNSNRNVFTRMQELENVNTNKAGIKCFAYMLDIQDSYAEFNINVYAGSLGGLVVDSFYQVFKLT